MAERQQLKFEEIDSEGLFWLDRVHDTQGKRRRLVCVPEFGLHGHEDEAVEMDACGETAKELLGRETAAGFRDIAHVMRFATGSAELPKPVELGPDADDGGALVCA